MTVLNPGHLFDQAQRLVASASGPPRQVDLRRAISTAYYGVFHFTLAALGDLFIGSSQRTSRRYALVYRSIDHRTLKEICIEVQKPSPSKRYAAYAPSIDLGPHVRAFAVAVTDLQDKRHRADYDPAARFRTSDARFAIVAARRAIERFELADPEFQKLFLTFLLCPPR